MPGGAALGGGAAAPGTLVVLLGLATLVPLVFMSLTAFVKISTVLQIVRGALGAPSIPSNVVVLALSAALAALAMAPVGERIVERATPVLERPDLGSLDGLRALGRAAWEPLHDFLRANSAERERDRFLELAREARPPEERASVAPDSAAVVVPAFITTELMEAFALGFALYLPFVVLDLLVANVLVALGVAALSPTQVSLPFKLLLFVAIDGWGLLAEALVASYR